MAANYWDSTQALYWTFTKSELADLRKQLSDANAHLYTRYPLPDRRLMSIYLQQNLIRLAKRMSLRQQALATAQAYMKRFYLRVEMRKTNPYLIMTTAVYLACKVEECPQHIRLMLGEAARQWPELNVSESSKIGECEFALISTLNSRLIVHHPYRSLSELSPLFGLSAEEYALAHSIINDSYNADLLLTNPPHIIAIAAILLAVVLRPTHQPLSAFASSSASPNSGSPLTSASGHGPFSPTIASPGTPTVSATAAQSALFGFQASVKQAGPKLAKLMDWLAESKVDMTALANATQELISLYEIWEQYYERTCKDAITKFMQGLTK